MPHPRVMGAGSGLCSTRLQQLLAFFGLWLRDSSLCLHLHNDFVCVAGGCMDVCVCVCLWLHDSSLCLHLHNDFMCVCVCVCVCVRVCACAHTCMRAPCVWYEIFLCDMKSYSVPVIKTCMRLQVLGIRMWIFFQEAIFLACCHHVVGFVFLSKWYEW